MITDVVGRGGMGVVYAAYDPDLERKVALKLIRPDRHSMDDGEAQARLLREARTLAALSHPNVVSIYDVETFEHQVVLTMEYVDGATLKSWLTSKPRGFSDILDVFVQAGRGLAAAHAAGIIHRDFKPSNVLISREGQVKVLDFGLARSTEQDTERDSAAASITRPTSGESPRAPSRTDAKMTQTGLCDGDSAVHVARAASRPPAGSRTDQFSFASRFGRLFTGPTRSRGRTTAELARSTAKGAVQEPRHPKRAPAFVRVVLEKGLKPKPSQRYESMRELLGALQRDPAALRRRAASFAGAQRDCGGGGRPGADLRQRTRRMRRGRREVGLGVVGRPTGCGEPSFFGHRARLRRPGVVPSLHATRRLR